MQLHAKDTDDGTKAFTTVHTVDNMMTHHKTMEIGQKEETLYYFLYITIPLISKDALGKW